MANKTAKPNEMNHLIGRKFKRNKYGLSSWVDTIANVGYTHVHATEGGCMTEVHVYGMKSNHCYDLKEIVISPEPQELKRKELLGLLEDSNKRLLIP